MAESHVIQHLRRKKAEQAYTSWLKKLQQRYLIDINRIQWEKIAGSQTAPSIDPMAKGVANGK